MSDELSLIEPVVGDEELENIESVIESGYLTEGSVTRDFEEKFANYVDAEHAIAVTSCTTGLELALEALDVGPGDEVPLPDFTYPATANAVVRVGADPILVDVDRKTYNIDIDALKQAISDDTAALLPVSWGGQPLPTQPLRELSDDHDIPIVEDAACSSGAKYCGQPVGSQFDISVFSFHPRKILTTGEGGMITTDDEEVAERIRSIKNFGTKSRETDLEFANPSATNARFNDVLAAIGLAQLEKIEKIVEKRRIIAQKYTDLLTDVEGLVPPREIDGGRHNYQSYCVYVEGGGSQNRDCLIEALADRGIEAQMGTYALHRTEAFSDMRKVGSLNAALSLYHRLLTLPLNHEMTKDDSQRVVTELKSALERL